MLMEPILSLHYVAEMPLSLRYTPLKRSIIKPNNLLGLQLQTLNGGERSKDPVEGLRFHGEPIRV